MSIFKRIRDSFKRSFNQATSSTTAASQRNERRNQSAPSTATGRVVDNLLTDIAIGFGRLDASDVGQAGIDDYNRRTQDSIKAMKDLEERNRRDSGSSTSPPAPAAPTTTTAEPVTATPEPPAQTTEPVKLTPVTTPDPTTEGDKAPTTPDTGAGTTTAVGAEEEADTLEAGATGDAEKKVADTIRKRGRRRNIATSAQGLLSQAPTRRRRSLMGGGLLR
tara:strand:+ start:50 stop:709 length:660 start_codon:yes stop_codon:yes gene_type:complete